MNAPFDVITKRFFVIFELNKTVIKTELWADSKKSIQKTLNRFASENGNKIRLLSCEEANYDRRQEN